MKRIKIAFGHQARTGKDTAADYITKKLTREGSKCQKFSFAGAIYDIMEYAQKRCGLPLEKDRSFLQVVGTSWGRIKNPNLWINVALNDIRALEPDTHVIVTDVRFINEFEALKKEGFLMVKITRDTNNMSFGSGSAIHVSETELLRYEGKWDMIITNNGSLEDFYKTLDILLKNQGI